MNARTSPSALEMLERCYAARTWKLAVATTALLTSTQTLAAITCERQLTAEVVAIDQPLMFNRLGAANVNGMIFALKRDVVDKNGVPLLPASLGGQAVPGEVSLRPDKRPRPLVLRVSAGDCLTVKFTNLLTPNPNPFEVAPNQQNPTPNPLNGRVVPPNSNVPQIATFIDEQVKGRWASFHANGMQLIDSIASDGSWVGKNANSLAQQGPGGYKEYRLYAEKEGVYIVQSYGATLGSDGNEGNISNGLFGQIIVEPKGAKSYRSLLTEEEMRLITDYTKGCVNPMSCNGIVNPGRTATGHPVIDYEAPYPNQEPWISEGKANLPILAMVDAYGNIVHAELEAMNIGPNADGSFPPSTYPLESKGYRNPTVPNRLEPFRDFASVFHDETANAQAFPGFYTQDPVFKYVLAGVKDAFMINYGSGGIGSEIIANRLGVGPMHDCLNCAYEEFFLTSHAVGDPALLVDVPANVGLENCKPDLTGCEMVGPKANFALYPNDPINVHHSYIGDFAKIRNTHIGKEQHVFHLHNHQWLYNPNDDNSNYLDAQGVGPGSGYTYEINFGGSGNRNKSAGDSIFHCHFYPHFAQGMWYHWRHYDTLEEGTLLQVSVEAGSVTVPDKPGTFHGVKWAQQNGTPAAGSRALPDGELLMGVPIAAIVPLPGKPMAPLPAKVTVVANPATTATGRSVGSLAQVFRTTTPDPATGKCPKDNLYGEDCKAGTDDDVNPGYPFWIAGIEDTVGNRPPTPVMDMITKDQAEVLVSNYVCKDNTTDEIVGKPPCAASATEIANPDYALFSPTLIPAQADGWDGGLPRHALKGLAAGGEVEVNVVTPRDFTKVMAKAEPVFFPEGGTDAERAAMRFHKKGRHVTSVPNKDGTASTGTGQQFEFITNGTGPVVGAPYHEPCVDDSQKHLVAGFTGNFFSGESGTAAFSVLASARPNTEGKQTTGRSNFNATTPRIYKGANIQFDAILNKVGYHYPQQRIITLWEDAMPVINKEQPPEPLVMRLNTFDCALYSHTNLVPEYYEMDDYQVRTPTDIIGQHIHLPKWDLTTTDGSGNGWNYEDGTLSPGAVRERIHAINLRNIDRVCNNEAAIVPPASATHGATPVSHTCPAGTTLAGSPVSVPELHAAAHPFFGKAEYNRPDWIGARTTIQRWFADPVVNTEGIDRGLGIIFTHDHYGPSTHQQIGLYATVLTEPAGSTWVHNETGVQLGAGPGGSGGRMDGGPTSWQAAILPPEDGANTSVEPDKVGSFREFYMEFADFQHAYEAGVYVGADKDGVPIPPAGTFADAGIGEPGPNPRINRVTGTDLANAFRFAINPPARLQVSPLYPDLVLEVAGLPDQHPGCPWRPCPQAISVEDPGMFVNNYRNEPIGLRVFDPNKLGPDGKPGMQADGVEGDLAFALASQLMDKTGNWPPDSKDTGPAPITRKIDALNKTEAELGFWKGATLNQPGATIGGDPMTPMMRAYAGDIIRMKIQAGAHEEEHNGTIVGMKWLQAGSGHGKAPNSGWRSSQAAGISEQFTLSIPILPPTGSKKGARDYLYNIDSSADGWWSGTWGLLRTYDELQTGQAYLYPLPDNKNVKPDRVANRDKFAGVCRGVTSTNRGKTITTPLDLKPFDVIAILANDLLPNPGVTIKPAGSDNQHVGAKLTEGVGGTLVYNPRTTQVGGQTVQTEEGPITLPTHYGPIHDPTAMLYVDARDVEPRDGFAGKGACKNSGNNLGVGNASCPIQLKANKKVEPLIIRANADDCVQVTLYNRLPATAPDLPGLSTLLGVVKRDRNDPQGSIPFDNNLIRPSSHVGIAPQLVALDVREQLGMNVGVNITQTVPPVDATGKSGKETFTWYMGDLLHEPRSDGDVDLVATPVEFGGFSLSPTDRIKQGQKSLVGGMSVAPKGATVQVDTVDGTPTGNVKTRAQASVTADGKTFRDFMLVMTKHVSQRYADGAAVEHMNGEAIGIPEDPQEASGMALNYGIEPLWFRLGLVPQAPFGGAGCGAGCYGGVDKAEQAYSNNLPMPGGTTATGEPATPIFLAKPGAEVRLHSAVPHGTSRGTTWIVHGHVWQRDPYVCNGESRNSLTGACDMTSVGSRAIGDNPFGFAQGAQESITPLSHFTFRFPSAGGAANVDTYGKPLAYPPVKGDFLFRDVGSFGNASGLWGLLRVDPAAPQ